MAFSFLLLATLFAAVAAQPLPSVSDNGGSGLEKRNLRMTIHFLLGLIVVPCLVGAQVCVAKHFYGRCPVWMLNALGRLGRRWRGDLHPAWYRNEQALYERYTDGYEYGCERDSATDGQRRWRGLWMLASGFLWPVFLVWTALWHVCVLLPYLVVVRRVSRGRSQSADVLDVRFHQNGNHHYMACRILHMVSLRARPSSAAQPPGHEIYCFPCSFWLMRAIEAIAEATAFDGGFWLGCKDSARAMLIGATRRQHENHPPPAYSPAAAGRPDGPPPPQYSPGNERGNRDINGHDIRHDRSENASNASNASIANSNTNHSIDENLARLNSSPVNQASQASQSSQVDQVNEIEPGDLNGRQANQIDETGQSSQVDQVDRTNPNEDSVQPFVRRRLSRRLPPSAYPPPGHDSEARVPDRPAPDRYSMGMSWIAVLPPDEVNVPPPVYSLEIDPATSRGVPDGAERDGWIPLMFMAYSSDQELLPATATPDEDLLDDEVPGFMLPPPLLPLNNGHPSISSDSSSETSLSPSLQEAIAPFVGTLNGPAP